MGIKNPEISILSNHCEPLSNRPESPDLFAFESRLAPAFDILRHKATSTPTAIALYGSKGTGRTTALRWLMEQSNEWNQIPQDTRDGHPQIIPVWVSAPHLKDQAYPERGIVSNMALKCLNQPQETEAKQTLLQQLVESGAEALGHGFASQIQKLAAQWEMNNLPATGLPADEAMASESCLAVLSNWLKHQNANLRIVVFIDGLDHCPPHVAMSVLDAIGLQFRSGDFVFVVGLDDAIAQKMIARQQREYGYEDGEARPYLSRIFPVECQIAPSRLQLKNFYEHQLNLLTKRAVNCLNAICRRNKKNISKPPFFAWRKTIPEK